MNDKSTWQTFFDAHAPHYEGNVFTKNTLEEVDFLEEILELDAGASILDVGCGTGRHAVELAKRGYRVTGVDLSEKMLEEAVKAARAAEVEVKWVHADATSFSFPEPFDAAICLCEGSFGLLGDGDDPIAHPAAILRNICGSLAPGGHALFTVLNGISMARRVSQEDVAAERFDPIAVVEVTEIPPSEGDPPMRVRERAFFPTELALLFPLAGLSVLHMWGGTAGNWGKRPLDLDEMEIMVVARNSLDN